MSSETCRCPGKHILCYLEHRGRKCCTSGWHYSNDLCQWLWEEEPQSHPAWNVLHILFLMLVVCAVHYLPEVALFGVDEADSGILLVGVCGTKLVIFTGKVFKLHTHCHWVSVCLWGWRHGALNGFICFPKKIRQLLEPHILWCLHVWCSLAEFYKITTSQYTSTRLVSPGSGS